MITGITIHSVFVLDYDAALDFYVGKLGFTVKGDVDLGFMRWLTVAPAAQPDREILLTIPGPPVTSPEATTQIRELLAQGALGTAAILSTDDCRATYRDLVEKGVEFTEEPQEQPYGIDCALRDPFGNHIRITQQTELGEFSAEKVAEWENSFGQ